MDIPQHINPTGLRELALFAGMGGGLYGSILSGWRTVCAVEINKHCQQVLRQRQFDGIFPEFDIWDDIKTFDGTEWRGRIDIVSGGFPCQPLSINGPALGETDERNLWPDTLRVIREVGPRFCFLENVPGLLARDYFGQIIGELAEAGYRVEWEVIPASPFVDQLAGKRIWILATTMREGLEGIHKKVRGIDLQSTTRLVPGFNRSATPRICRASDGVANRIERIRAIGNGQVPALAHAAWEVLRQDRP